MKLSVLFGMLSLSLSALATEAKTVPAPIDFSGFKAEAEYSPLDYSSRPMLEAEQKQRAKSRTRIAPLQGKTNGSFDFQLVSVSQLVTLLYGEAVKTPYVIAPEVLQDQRLVSFRFNTKNGDLKAFLSMFLDSLGFGVETRSGVDFVFKRRDVEVAVEPDRDTFVYHPRYRDTAYLSRLASPLFQGRFTVNREISAPDNARVGGEVTPGSAASLIDQRGDTLLFHGTPTEIAALKRLLPQLDTPMGEVSVRAAAYEVVNSVERGSAFQLALDLLSKGLGIEVTIDGDKFGNAIRLRAGDFSTALSALSKDSRFQVINSPNLRIRSGARGRLTVGQKVPVLKSVSYPRGGGEPVQSVEYHSSGVIFELSPTVKDRIIDLRVTQQISDFVKTTTGVNNSPTLNTREVSTEISLHDGDLILMGGLTTNKSTDNRTGLAFLPRFLDSHSDASSNTEILLMLQVERVRATSVGSVGAVAEAERAHEPNREVRADDARPSAPRATEQRVALPTSTEALTSTTHSLTANRPAVSPVREVAMMREKATRRAAPAARRGEDGGGARSAPLDLYQ
ncbi:type II secretion system protein GspD [Pandoraea commovens]|uniref:Type II secretory pathway, component PulD n=1 Tax=Pandoraea commovens TaxID=2508289 RepID=A0A5E4YXP4_9BURK|nr:type II secretory pathway protein [Pandoraea commovens]VVE53167.1 Type II secretory pathway, component PulD [Pandoraea commovens]